LNFIPLSHETPFHLDDIRDYFGVKIAMYFGWLGLYTKWLFAPAIFGIIMFILMSRGEVIRDWCMFIFSIFNIVWATLYLEAWKRKSAELAYRWGTLDMPSEALKDPRVLFEVMYDKYDIEVLTAAFLHSEYQGLVV
jgi:anoctamin-8